MFNKNLSDLRKKNGLTQEALAEKLGVSRQAVARWEAGETAPDVYMLKGLSEIFGVSADALLNDGYAQSKPDEADFKPSPEPEIAPAAVAAPKRAPRPAILISAAVLLAVIAAAVLISLETIPLLMFSTADVDETVEESAPAKLTSLSYSRETSYAAKTEFWTAEEYEKWAEEQLEYYRGMYENGEEVLWHIESGGEEYRVLTEYDLEEMKKSTEETLRAIADGDLYTKDDVISWTGRDGKRYAICMTDVIAQSSSGQVSETVDSEISDVFLTYDPTGAATTAATAENGAEKDGLSLEERFAQYAEFGLRYDEKNGERRLYWHGEAVSKFLDLSPDGGIFVFSPDGGGSVRVQTDYDGRGELKGIKEIGE